LVELLQKALADESVGVSKPPPSTGLQLQTEVVKVDEEEDSDVDLGFLNETSEQEQNTPATELKQSPGPQVQHKNQVVHCKRRRRIRPRTVLRLKRKNF